jgi:hypothetical protein
MLNRTFVDCQSKVLEVLFGTRTTIIRTHTAIIRTHTAIIRTHTAIIRTHTAIIRTHTAIIRPMLLPVSQSRVLEVLSGLSLTLTLQRCCSGRRCLPECGGWHNACKHISAARAGL